MWLESDTNVENCLKCGENANELFEKLPHPDNVSWNILIAAHVKNGNWKQLSISTKNGACRSETQVEHLVREHP